MADDSPTTRAGRRAAAQARREAKADNREALFQALASGRTARQIADARKVSVRTIQREIDRAVAEKRLDAPERFVHLQVARLTKALRLANASIDRGELRAVAPLVKIVAALDRYHGLKQPQRPMTGAANPPDPAPPPALTHAAPPLSGLAAEVEGATDFRA